MARILIIDDDLSVQSVFQQFLECLGYETELAADGREGMRLIRQNAPDLIITDIMMPEMDGLEIVQEVRAGHPDLPVIAISGGMRAAPMNFLPLAKRFGACQVLEKPISLADLKQAVDKALNDSSN